ncbi:MAG: UDP-N-acetylmuramoyl-L-alanyl-D-glutamate--2,6-diaminopimelate ligase [Gracilibacteraceae bacterium]|jgi:UDP-N-acetylmuramoyl-L-alanyl-D-glutamate--2,6-diaminopimelate ligase|nr:UDP-N-acetylmuramoyl-L-alanyl-D-glutamate--2,6-diaminopimelate ligase [Gracilibacteraceae bacterium]
MRAGERKNLAELAMSAPGAVRRGEAWITGLQADSRRVAAGDLFICVPGFHVDGHDFAAAAVARGAAALLTSRPLDLPAPQIVVPDVRQAAGLVAAAFFGYPGEKLRLSGVTGTNGKTTVVHLIERVALAAGRPAGSIGTLGARFGGQTAPTAHTTPEAAELQGLLAQMAASGVREVAMEVSSQGLDLGRLGGCRFAAAVFTNLTQDHLDYHGTMERYLAAKAELFASLTAPAGFALLNTDDEAGRRLAALTPCRLATYALDDPAADYRAVNIRQTADGVRFTVRRGLTAEEVFCPVPGRFSVYNALAAWAWGLESGCGAETARRALAGAETPGRFELIRAGQKFRVVVDYAHTPDGLANVLDAAREITSGRLLTVFGCGGDRDRGKRPLMGEAAARRSDHVVLTSDNPRGEAPEAIISDIAPGVRGKGASWEIIPDRRTAIRRAVAMAAAGDTVVIAGKGHEDYQIIGAEKFPFDDREEARLALAALPRAEG